MARQRLFVLATLAATACADTIPTQRNGWGLAEVQWEQSCQQGAARACGQLGDFLIQHSSGPSGDDGDRDLERGLVLLEKACGQEDRLSCVSLGKIYVRFKQRSAHVRARELLQGACAGQSADACTALGEAIALLEPDDPAAAVASLQRACELGDARGCELYGLNQLRNEMSGNKAAAEDAFARACTSGSRSSCHILAMIHLRDSSRKDKGASMLAANCDRGYAESCLTIATVFAPLLGDHPDCERARVWAGKACAARAPEGCAIADACQLQRKELHGAAVDALRGACERRSPLACLYWADAQGSQPEGTDGADRVRAAYVNACNKNGPGQGVACVRIAVADLAKAQSAIDADRPLDFLRRACERSSAQACCVLAAEYDRGRWVSADPVKVTEFRRKACDLGAQSCCGAKART